MNLNQIVISKSFKSTQSKPQKFSGPAIKAKSTENSTEIKAKASLKEALVEAGIIVAGILSETLFIIAYPFLLIYKAIKKLKQKLS